MTVQCSQLYGRGLVYILDLFWPLFSHWLHGSELKNICLECKLRLLVVGGNAYGLANTLTQTAFLRPNLKSKKVKKLYFSGQLTVPGPGVPPAVVSGKLVADLIQKNEGSI